MVLTNIKNKQKESGFTIVELLVVIVVIGILAAITIVSYTGITAKANATTALSNANSVKQVADVFYAEKNYYPAANATTAMIITDWTSQPTTSKVPSGVNVIRTAVDNGSGKNSVSVECLTTCTTTTGLRIGYWDYAAATPGVKYIYVGEASSTSPTFVFPAAS